MDFAPINEVSRLDQELHWRLRKYAEEINTTCLLHSLLLCQVLSVGARYLAGWIFRYLARWIFGLNWQGLYCGLFPKLSPNLFYSTDYSGNASSFSFCLTLPVWLFIWWFFSFPLGPRLPLQVWEPGNVVFTLIAWEWRELQKLL